MRTIILIVCGFLSVASTAQIAITKNGKPVSRIVVDMGDTIDLKAATLLQDFVKRISGAGLTIVPAPSKPVKGDILIVNSNNNNERANEIKEDGFLISTKNGSVNIVGGKGKGTIYGVVTLLEQYFNVQYYAENTCTFTT